MKKLFLFFLTIIFASFVSASICCTEGCFPETAEYGGNTYTLKCCSEAGIPEQEGTAYLGCKGSNLNSYCLNEFFGGCLKCEYNTVDGYHWVDKDIEADLCGDCKVCEYGGNIDIPSQSECVFDIDPVSDLSYHCIAQTISTCLIEGGFSGDYCCKTEDINPLDDYGDIDVKTSTACAPYIGTPPNENSCFHGSSPECSSANGWECDTYEEDQAVDYVGCYTKGEIDYRDPEITTDDRCYYTDRIVSCTQTGWNCESGDSCVIGECTVPSDVDNDGTPDVCDTETTPEDCIDDVDNDGNGKCDVNGCSEMPAEPNCAAELCSQCKWPACSEATCEGAYKSSTGTGSCYYDTSGFIPKCCDDSDSDDICDSKDNCPRNANGNEPLNNVDYNNDGDKLDNQNDADADGIGNECDICPTIKQSESILSDDNKKLCTTSGEIACTNKCEIVDVGEEFFCDGTVWISINQCFGCFYSNNIEYYWIDDYDKICDLTNKNLIETDNTADVCELLEAGIQDICEEGETGCWDIDASGTNTKCCGDDAADDTWIDINNKACSNGIFYTDADDLALLCELVSSGEQGDCSIHNEIGCWYDSKCCGDDSDETWTYSTNNRIDDILVDAGCYKGKWFVRTNAKVTYYEILI